MQTFDIGTSSKKLVKFKDIVEPKKNTTILSSFPIINKLFGNGLSEGSTFQIFGNRGCGKTTMMLQLLEDFSKVCEVAYISTEESEEQLLQKCPRLSVENVALGYMTDLEDILEIIRSYKIVVVDSFQMINSELNQKKIITKLVAEAKKYKCCLGIVCQLTKQGSVKGVSDIGHICDQTIKLSAGVPEYFGMNPDSAIIVDTDKNRNGKTGIVVFRNGDAGYEFESPWNDDGLVDDLEKCSYKKD